MAFCEVFELQRNQQLPTQSAAAIKIVSSVYFAKCIMGCISTVWLRAADFYLPFIIDITQKYY